MWARLPCASSMGAATSRNLWGCSAISRVRHGTPSLPCRTVAAVPRATRSAGRTGQRPDRLVDRGLALLDGIRVETRPADEAVVRQPHHHDALHEERRAVDVTPVPHPFRPR